LHSGQTAIAMKVIFCVSKLRTYPDTDTGACTTNKTCS